MAQKPFGSILAEERERQGIDITYAANQLRIRADILHAIEHNDFARMPARGYTRNMVNAYARLLGLNAPSITRQYLDEANAYQVSLRDGYPRSSRDGRYSDRDSGNSNRQSRSRSRRGGSYDEERGSSHSRRAGSDRSSSRDRGLDGINSRHSRDTYSDRQERHPQSSGSSMHYGHGQNNYDFNRRGRQYRGNSMPSSGRGGINLPVNLPMIIGIIIAIALVIFIITQIIGCVSPKPTTANTSVPITGVADTTGGDNANNTNTNVNAANVAVATPPTEAVVKYTVKSGSSTYMEIYLDGSTTASVAEVVTGPASETYSVTNQFTIKVIDNTALTLTVDGVEVALTADGTGLYTYTVDFATILDQWAKEHKSSSSTTNTNSTTSTSNTNANANTTTNTTTSTRTNTTA